MLTRRHLAAGLGSLPLIASQVWANRAWAGETPLGAPAQTLPDAPVSLDSLIRGGLDLQERLTIPVMIGGAGPFDFAVDTGADRSCLSDSLAEQLALPPGPSVMIHGIAGAALSPTVQIPGLMVGRETLKGANVPVLPRQHLGVDGLLGVDALQKRRLVMNYRERVMQILPPDRRDDAQGTTRSALVTARNRQGLLTVPGAKADGVSVEAFVDSGGALSVGNLALARALGLKVDGVANDAPRVSMMDVTGEEAVGPVHVVRSLKFGSMRFTDMGLVFCDLHVFDRWGMSDWPAVLVGANALRLFSRIEMDYGSRRIYFEMAADPPIWLADNDAFG